MNWNYRQCLVALSLGFVPLTASADHGAAVPAPPISISEPAVFSPFGYFPTHWRPYPAPPALLPEPSGAPIRVGSRVSRGFTVPAPLAVNEPAPLSPIMRAGVRTSMAAPSGNYEARVPQPASIHATERTAATPQNGFATLRTPAPLPKSYTTPATAIAAPPIPDPPAPSAINSGLRTTIYSDDIVRPAWPVIPPPKK